MYTFDGPNKLIILDFGVTSFTAIDLYSRWKNWVQLSDNAKWIHAFETIGGESIGGGQSISPYFFVANGWKIRPHEADHDLTVTGNLLQDGGGTPFIDTIGSFNVKITVIVSSNSLTTSINAQEIWDYGTGNSLAINGFGEALKNMMDAYTVLRAAGLDNLDTTISSRESETDASTRAADDIQEHVDTQAAIAAIDVTADVQAGLDAQGYTTGRAAALSNLDTTISSRESEADALSRANTNQTEHDDTQAAIAALNNPTLANIAMVVWDSLVATTYTVGSFGEMFKTNVDTTISSRQSETAALSRFNTLDAKLDAIDLELDSIVATVDYDLIADGVWGALTANDSTSTAWAAGTFATLINTNLDGAISSRLSESTHLARYNTLVSEHDATQVDISNIDTTADVSNALTSQGYTGARAILLDNLDATISSRLSTTDANANQVLLIAEHDATQLSITNIDVTADVQAGLTAEGFTSTRAAKLDNLDNLDATISGLPTATVIADAVWNEDITTHVTADSTGLYLTDSRGFALISSQNTQS